jgi:hypothetical protein
MKPTTRISAPQRGHTRGSTSYTRRIISAQPRLSAARSAPLWGRCPLGCLAWGGGLGRGGALLAFAPGRVRIEAVVADRMASWVRDLHQDPGYEVHRVDSLALGLLGLVVPSLARVGGRIM